jgi:hypothetical protein
VLGAEAADWGVGDIVGAFVDQMVVMVVYT